MQTQSQALQLRIDDLSYAEIGTRLGISKTRAYELVTAAVAELALERKHEAATLLERDWHATNELLGKFHPLAVDDGDEKAAKIVLDTIELRAKMRGYLAPAKTQILGSENLSFLSRDEMKAEVQNRVSKILEGSPN